MPLLNIYPHYSRRDV